MAFSQPKVRDCPGPEGAPSVDLRRRVFPSAEADRQPLGLGSGLTVLVNWI
jgi:hypothetical protein